MPLSKLIPRGDRIKQLFQVDQAHMCIVKPQYIKTSIHQDSHLR